MLLRTSVRTLLFGLLMLSTPISAQDGGHGRRPRVSVTVVLMNTLPGEASFQLLRRADRVPHDVILLSAAADSAELSTAVIQLISLRKVQGDTAAASGMMRLRQPQATQSHHNVLPWAGRVVTDLRRAPMRNVNGIGNVRNLEIYLPAQRRGFEMRH